MIEALLKMIVDGIVGNFSYDRLKSIFKKPPENPDHSTAQVENQDGSEELTKAVPGNIEFGTQLLRTPSLEEIGIPVPFAYFPYITCHVKAGEWVDRGDPLITYTFVYYQLDKKLPRFFRLILGDRTRVQTVQLDSPVSGFVTDLRKVTCRESQFGAYAGTFLGIFNAVAILPTLLLPREEPAWTQSHLSNVRSQICRSIVNNWEVNRHNLGGLEGRYRIVRISEAISMDLFWNQDESHKQQLSEAIAWAGSEPCSKFQDEVSWPICEYTEYKTSYNSTLHERIEQYRAQDYTLRDKLVHLTRLAAKEQH